MLRIHVCALLCAIGTIVPAESSERPSPYLKDVKIVSYQLSVEPPNMGNCAIDLNAWNTALDFVANQSTKLKLIRERGHREQEKQLSDEARKASENFARRLPDDMAQIAENEKDEAQERAAKFLYAPSLLFSVQATDMTIGCAGTIRAEVSAGLEPAKIIATGKIARQPYMKVWSDQWVIKARYDAFPHVLTETSKQIMKTFVNDWAISQE